MEEGGGQMSHVRQASPTRIRRAASSTNTTCRPETSGAEQVSKIWREYIGTAAFEYDSVSNLSFKGLAKVPNNDESIANTRELHCNGIIDTIMVTSVPSSPREWRIDGTRVEIYGDVRLDDDVYLVKYPFV